MSYPTTGDIAFGHVPKVVRLYREVLRDTGARHGIAVIDGGRAFADADRPAEELWTDSMRPSPLGHLVLGKAVARALRRWVRGASVMITGEGGERPTYAEPRSADL